MKIPRETRWFSSPESDGANDSNISSELILWSLDWIELKQWSESQQTWRSAVRDRITVKHVTVAGSFSFTYVCLPLHVSKINNAAHHPPLLFSPSFLSFSATHHKKITRHPLRLPRRYWIRTFTTAKIHCVPDERTDVACTRAECKIAEEEKWGTMSDSYLLSKSLYVYYMYIWEYLQCSACARLLKQAGKICIFVDFDVDIIKWTTFALQPIIFCNQ